MGLSRIEQEVIINFNAVEETAEVYTADPVWIRKMDKLVEQNPEAFKCKRQESYQGKVIAKCYTFPKKLISIRKKSKGDSLTEEQRLALVKRLAASRNQF